MTGNCLEPQEKFDLDVAEQQAAAEMLESRPKCGQLSDPSSAFGLIGDPT